MTVAEDNSSHDLTVASTRPPTVAELGDEWSPNTRLAALKAASNDLPTDHHPTDAPPQEGGGDAALDPASFLELWEPFWLSLKQKLEGELNSIVYHGVHNRNGLIARIMSHLKVVETKNLTDSKKKQLKQRTQLDRLQPLDIGMTLTALRKLRRLVVVRAGGAASATTTKGFFSGDATLGAATTTSTRRDGRADPDATAAALYDFRGIQQAACALLDHRRFAFSGADLALTAAGLEDIYGLGILSHPPFYPPAHHGSRR